ncbi:MAG TPA: glycosyltransferase family 39 protein [Pyrinomonadaceae bacterium]|jgi:4-amino-4-deoxy-L-arabinose transferase-like glycosyltransferase|nr:glycosyltransferase family 39 protein [Pyrinomonadaceae bacterium]
MLAKRAGLVLFAAACVAVFWGLGSAPLLGADEPRYAQVAREMFARGDWVTPTLGGQTWFEKPALLYWLMMAAYGALGVTELAARVGAAVSGLVVMLLVGALARRVEFESGERLRGFGFAGSLVIASTLGLLVFARAASFDVLLTATVTAALTFFFLSEHERGGMGRQRMLVGFYACVGLSLLAKGLVGVVLPGGVVLLYFVLRGRLPNPLRLGALWGVPLCLLVAAVWYGPVMAKHGRVFVDEFFVQHHFARYVSNRYNHPQPFYFYLPITLLLTLPWTFFLLSGLRGVFETNWRSEDAESRLAVFALVWLLVPVVFFSVSGSKLPGYVLPAVPGAALLAARRVHKYLRGEGELLTMRLTGATALCVVGAGAFYFYRSGVKGGLLGPAVPEWAAALLLTPGLVCGLVAVATPRRRALCVNALAAAVLVTVVLAASVALGRYAERESVAGLLRRADAEGFGGVPVYQLHTVERTSEFYAAGRLAYDERGEPRKFEGMPDVMRELRAAGGRGLVLVPVKHAGQLEQVEGAETRVVGDNGQYALVGVKAN